MLKRNYSLDILRIFACLGVIMIHAAGSPEIHHWVQAGTDEWKWCAAFDALSRWSVPVFAMLTGFIFLNPYKELPLSKLYGKYIARIATALVFWSCFYAFTLHRTYYPFGVQGGHFWYLGMCIGLYMAVPIMRSVINNAKLLSYFCWTWLFFKIYSFIGYFTTLPFDLSNHHLFADYVGYSLWAYYLNSIVLARKHELLIYCFAVICSLVNVIGYYVTKDVNCYFARYNAVTNIAISFGLFYLCSHHIINLGLKINKVILTISSCTFGIYLIHLWMLISVIFTVHDFFPTSPIYTVLISVCLVFGGGLVVTYILKQIPLLKKWIV